VAGPGHVTTGDPDPGAPGPRIGRTFAGSEGWWPPRPTPPPGAPNVVVMLADDLGFADLGCYGSEIATPNLDALAAGGLRYTNFHVTPMCSPTRSALLTGFDHHRAGFGTVAHADAGFPGYAMELPPDAATLPEILRDHGYATFMVGKWHLAKDSDCSAAGPRHSWPCQRGFDRFYGFLDAFTNLHQPHRLTEDNHAVETDRYPDGYYLTDDLTDRSISMVREAKASNPEQPFLLYFAHGAVHAPLHAKAVDIERYRGAYEAGWDDLRVSRHRRQLELGVIAEGTPLAPRNTEANHDVKPWDELGDREKELFARHMEVYAGMVDNIDQNVGRLTAALAELGELDNTIFIFTSDNGASREGEVAGTSSYYVHLLQGVDLDADHARLNLLGGPQTTPHYPRGWAMASNTPFRLYKINTHAGGHTVPFIVSWPERLADQAGGLRRQYSHITDLLPTLLDLIGVERPPERHGVPLAPLSGASFGPTLTDPQALSRHTRQVEEMNGHRGYYEDGWEIVTLHQPLTPFGDDEWELYDLTTDPVELHDLAAERPDKVAELAARWETAARAGQIYPLDEGSSIKYLIRPPRSDVYREPVRIVADTPSLERWRSVQLVWFRSVEIAVDLVFRTGDQGVLVAHGDQGAGYALYVLDDELWFVHNDGRGTMRRLSGGILADGTTAIAAELVAPGGGSWTVTLRVGDEAGETDRGTLEGVPMLFGMAPFEGIDIGIDRRSPVDWALYERFGPFPWTGDLRAVTYAPGEDAPDSPGNLLPVIREMGLAFE
jgi:arylsulfatase A-like enzyme